MKWLSWFALAVVISGTPALLRLPASARNANRHIGTGRDVTRTMPDKITISTFQLFRMFPIRRAPENTWRADCGPTELGVRSAGRETISLPARADFTAVIRAARILRFARAQYSSVHIFPYINRYMPCICSSLERNLLPPAVQGDRKHTEICVVRPASAPGGMWGTN